MFTLPNIVATEGVLWSEQYQPASASELAVHRKKVQEVEDWFKWALDTARQSNREVRWLLTHHMCVTLCRCHSCMCVESYQHWVII